MLPFHDCQFLIEKGTLQINFSQKESMIKFQ